MKLQITGKNVTIDTQTRELINAKFTKAEHYAPTLVNMNIILEEEHASKIIHLTAHIDKADIHLKEEHDHFPKAIELIFERLNRQLKKHKHKQQHYTHDTIANHI